MIRVSQESIHPGVSFSEDVHWNSVVPGTVENACATWHLIERDDTVLLDTGRDELPIYYATASVCIVVVGKILLIPSSGL